MQTDRVIVAICAIGFTVLGVQTYLIAQMLVRITELIKLTH